MTPTPEDHTGEYPKPQSAAAWWTDLASKAAGPVTIAVLLFAGAWAVNVDRTLSRMEVLLEQLTDEAPKARAEAQEVKTRMTKFEVEKASDGKRLDKLETRVEKTQKELDERLRKLENGKRR